MDTTVEPTVESPVIPAEETQSPKAEPKKAKGKAKPKAEVKADLGSKSIKTDTILYFDPKDIVIREGYNVRDWSDKETAAHLKRMTESVIEHGVTNPGKVEFEGDTIYLVSGENRLRACLAAYEQGVERPFPAIVISSEGLSDLDKMIRLETDNTHKGFEYLERAELIAALSEGGMSNAAIGKKLNLSGVHIANHLLVHAVPEKLKSYMRKGTVKATYVLELLRRFNKDGEKVLAFVEDELTAQKMNNKGKGEDGEGDGEGRVTKKKAEGGSAKPTEQYMTRAAQKAFVRMLCEITRDNSLYHEDKSGKPIKTRANQGIRRMCKDILDEYDTPVDQILALIDAEEAEANQPEDEDEE